MSFHVFRTDLYRSPIAGYGLFESTLFLECISKIIENFRHGIIDRQRLSEFLLRLLNPFDLMKSKPEVVERRHTLQARNAGLPDTAP